MREAAMAGLTDFKKSGSNLQDYVNLILGVMLFLSPWALGFTGETTAARIAWFGGIVIAIVASGAIVVFAEWEEWLSLLIGLGVMASPFVFGFGHVMNAVMAHYVIGLLVFASSAWEIWAAHHPTPHMR
jgi:hypothetical protein